MTSLGLINRSDSGWTQTAAGNRRLRERERQEGERGGFEDGLRDKGKVKKRQREGVGVAEGRQEKHREKGRMGNRCQRLGVGLLERRRTGG